MLLSQIIVMLNVDCWKILSKLIQSKADYANHIKSIYNWMDLNKKNLKIYARPN